jgi:hypothetical protein
MYLSDQEMIITLGKLEKILHIFSNNIDYKILVQCEVSNLIQIINDYNIENKHYNRENKLNVIMSISEYS